MAATKKASYFRTNPGGSGVVNTPVLPGANGTWTNFTSAVGATQDSACTAAGYWDFDLPDANGDLDSYRSPFFTTA